VINKTLATLVLGALAFSSGVALAQPAEAGATFSKRYLTQAACASELAVLRNSGWVIKEACAIKLIPQVATHWQLTATR